MRPGIPKLREISMAGDRQGSQETQVLRAAWHPNSREGKRQIPARGQYKYPVNKTGTLWKVSLQEKDRSHRMWGTETHLNNHLSRLVSEPSLDAVDS